MRILVVEDDAALARQLEAAVAGAGYAVDRAPDGEEGEFLGETETYDAIVLDRHLSRARAAASHSVLGARCAVGPVGAALVRTLGALHRDRAVAIAVDGLDGLVFCGDRHDLEEMLGNLMDNASKWGRTQVRVAGRRVARPDGDRLELTVEDDGPGIPEAAVAEALVRGRRLDESVPGSGLGLAIVDDLAALYGGGLALRHSGLGGLAAVLDLPAALPRFLGPREPG